MLVTRSILHSLGIGQKEKEEKEGINPGLPIRALRKGEKRGRGESET